jgi:hypothetical protein
MRQGSLRQGVVDRCSRRTAGAAAGGCLAWCVRGGRERSGERDSAQGGRRGSSPWERGRARGLRLYGREARTRRRRYQRSYLRTPAQSQRGRAKRADRGARGGSRGVSGWWAPRRHVPGDFGTLPWCAGSAPRFDLATRSGRCCGAGPTTARAGDGGRARPGRRHPRVRPGIGTGASAAPRARASRRRRRRRGSGSWEPGWLRYGVCGDGYVDGGRVLATTATRAR